MRGPVCGQKWCISGNPGNKLSGHHLRAGSPLVCSQGMPCQVLWSGMLGLGRGGQRQLRLSKATLACTSNLPHKKHRLSIIRTSKIFNDSSPSGLTDGAFGNPLSDRDFHPAHLGTSRHKLSAQGCLGISSQGSCILKCTFRL